MAKLKSLIRERSTLSDDDVAAMTRLFDRYYEGGSPAQFTKDLASKTHVIELRNDDVLCGFSTLCIYDLDDVDSRGEGPIRIIFSGDTIIDHAYWGEQSLALAFCRFAGEIKAADPQRPLYWLLISMGHRTYRYLHSFAHHYHPRHDSGVDQQGAALAQLTADVAQRKFGAAYDRATGLVRFGAAATRLRPQWQDERSTKRLSPAIAYFLERNPQHAQGDELVCLCELEPSNLRSFALNAFREGFSRRPSDD
jgi:hypothetical protein